MRAIGKLTSLLLFVGLIAGVGIGVKSIPDVQRYLRIRQM